MMYNIVIGYDRNNRIPAYVLAESIMQYSSVPVTFTYLHRDMLGELSRPIEEYDSTEFSNNRFLTPYLFDYQGWTLFLDNDMIVQDDIKQLFDYRHDKYAVMCVKHNQMCESDTKFLGKKQHKYSFKNWSSVMLFNNNRCKELTPGYVKTAPGLDLHQFAWIDHSLIGELPLEWNYLVGNKNQTSNKPKLIHYTEGGPWYSESKTCEYYSEWNKVYQNLMLG